MLHNYEKLFFSNSDQSAKFIKLVNCFLVSDGDAGGVLCNHMVVQAVGAGMKIKVNIGIFYISSVQLKKHLHHC